MTTSARTHRGQNRLTVLVALSLAAFIISLDVTIVNVALPTLVRTLGATTTQLQWVVDAYSLVFAAFVLAAGSLSPPASRTGPRQVAPDFQTTADRPTNPQRPHPQAWPDRWDQGAQNVPSNTLPRDAMAPPDSAIRRFVSQRARHGQ